MLPIGTPGVVKQASGELVPARTMGNRPNGTVDLRLDYKGTPFFRLGIYPDDDAFPEGHPLAGQPHPRAGQLRQYDFAVWTPVADEPSVGAFYPTGVARPPVAEAPSPTPLQAPSADEQFRTDVRSRLAQLEADMAGAISLLCAIDAHLRGPTRALAESAAAYPAPPELPPDPTTPPAPGAPRTLIVPDTITPEREARP
jgi:hypothetical protein